MRHRNPLFKIINGTLVDLPSPINFSIWWNFGRLLGLVLTIQLLTGIFLAIHYTADVELAFSSVSHIFRDVNGGWLLRSAHANGASFFFICLYCHVGRGLYYGSYMFTKTWITGTTSDLSYSSCFPRIRPPVGTNKILGGNSDYQLILGLPLFRTKASHVTMGGFCSWQRHPDTFLYLPLSSSFHRGGDSRYPYFFPPRDRE